MIASQNYPVVRIAGAVGDLIDKIAEVCRLHSRISAELIYLIRCRLDQDIEVKLLCLTYKGFYDYVVCCAVGRDSDYLPGLPLLHHIFHQITHFCLLC